MQRKDHTDPGRRFWDWLATALVVMLIQVAAARLVMTDWSPYLYFTQTLAALGAMLGLCLGFSRFGGGAVRGLATAYTAVLLPWQLTRAVEAEAELGEKLASVAGRLWFSLGEFVARRPVEDVLLFVGLVSLGFWLIGLFAGYALFRNRDYLGAVLPAGIGMLVIQVYDNFMPVRIWALALYVFLALLLLGRLYLNETGERWDRERIFVTFEARRDLMNSLVAFAAITVLAAWSLPTSISNIETAARSWNDFTRPLRERLSNAVSALESPHGRGGEAQGDFYGETLAIGQTATQGESAVLTIETDAASDALPPRFYWRGHAYNLYTDGAWSNSSTELIEFAPESDELSLPEAGSERAELNFIVTVRLSQQKLLYAPAEPVWINRPGNVMGLPATEQTLDLAAWQAEPALSGGDRYEVRARVVNPTIEELRAAGENYPEWVTASYLNVPEELLAELQALAEEITAGQETPYDRAQAVTAYLRGEIEYSTTLVRPPSDRDPVAWVLFESKEGFCLQYASAEVLLLRSLGIPTRMAVGFAEGLAAEAEFAEVIQQTIYTVRRMDAHAWPEVYFPGIGWVEFEPTGNQNPLRRPLNESELLAAGDPAPVSPGLGLDEGFDALDGLSSDASAQDAVPFSQTLAARALWVIAWVVVAALAYALNLRYEWARRVPVYLSESYRRSGSEPPRWLDRWARWSELGSIERSFQAVNLSLRWLGRPQPVHVTAVGRADALQTLLPAARASVAGLLREHQSVLFSPHPGDPAYARRAAIDILMKTLQIHTRRLLERITGAPIHPDGTS